ncbi:MAG: hypothetical protein V1701_00620 [Planctomycetota bacterium]
MKSLFNGLWYLARRWGIHLLILAGISFLLLLVHRKAYESYSHDERFQINMSALQVMANPGWLIGTELEAPVKTSLRISVDTSIFDKTIVGKVQRHYENNPWVAGIESIEKRFPNEIIVKLEIRKPLVAVEVRRTKSRAYYYLVDSQSVRLPGEYAKVPELPMTVPIIVGVNTAPPVAGVRWNDPGLNDALAVASTMESYQIYAKLDVGQIDVTNAGGRRNPKESEITLWTKDKVAIQWGRAPNTGKFGELSVDEKIKNLNYVLSIAPQLKGIKYVKIQYRNPCITLNDQSKNK